VVATDCVENVVKSGVEISLFAGRLASHEQNTDERELREIVICKKYLSNQFDGAF